MKLLHLIILTLSILQLNCWAWQNCFTSEKLSYCKEKEENELTLIPPPDNGSGSQKQQIATPVISPSEETSNNTISISITCDTPEATIYYTNDGSEPIIDSSKSIKTVSRSSIQQKNHISREISSKAQVYTGEAIKISDEGSHTIKAVATKEGMLNSEKASGSYTIDKTIPTVTINENKKYLSGNEGAINEQVITWNSNRDGTYTIRKDSASCTDGSSIADGSVVAGNTISNTIQASSLSKGSNILRVCVKDSISTNTGSQTIEIFRDDDVPTITASPGSQSSTTSHSVILECDDASGSGCDKIVYTEDSTEPQINQQTGEIISGNLYETELTPGDNSITTYKYLARDNAGNISKTKTSIYKIDTVIPTVTIISYSPTSQINGVNNLTIDWNANRNGFYNIIIGDNCEEGVQASGENVSGGISINETNNSIVYNGDQLEEGENQIFICAKNYVEDLGFNSISILVDKTPPEITTTFSSNTFHTPQGILNLTCSDNNSCDKIYYTTDGNTPNYNPVSGEATGTLYNATSGIKLFSESEFNQSKTIKAIGIDSVDNISELFSKVITLKYPTSCKQIINTHSSIISGFQKIDTDGNGSTDNFQVYCDFWSENGENYSSSFLYFDNGTSTTRMTDNDSCKARGMKLFAPISKTHFEKGRNFVSNVLLKPKQVPSFNNSGALGPLGIYREQSGPGIISGGWFSYLPFNTYNPNNASLYSTQRGVGWKSIAGDKWWISDYTNITEPNGDYCANCWMSFSYNADGYVYHYNDLSAGHTYNYYLCDIFEKF